MKISETKDYELVATLNKPVHDLHFALYPQYFNRYKYEEMKTIFKSLMNDNRFLFLLVEEHDEAFGYAWIEIRDYPENAFKKGYQSVYVHQISIEETGRNKGYGTRLMEKVEHIAGSKGIDLIELDYWCENSVAKEFYKKQKFTKYREFVHKRL